MFPGTSLKREVIDVAFGELAWALGDEPASQADLYRTIVTYLRRHGDVAALMMQVVAQFGLSGPDDAEEIEQAIIDARAQVTTAIATLLCHLEGKRSIERFQSAAERLVRWYIAVCVTLATSTPSDAELLAMAGADG